MDDVLVYVILGMSLLYAVFLLFLYRKQRRQIGRIIEEFDMCSTSRYNMRRCRVRSILIFCIIHWIPYAEKR